MEFEYELIPPEGAPAFAALSRRDAFRTALAEVLPQATFRLTDSASDIPVAEGDIPLVERVTLIVDSAVSREIGRRALERLVAELGRPDVSVTNA
jgi:hypothetical protein